MTITVGLQYEVYSSVPAIRKYAKWVVDFSQATKWDERTIDHVPTQSPMVHNVTDVKMRCKSMSASQPNNAMH